MYNTRPSAAAQSQGNPLASYSSQPSHAAAHYAQYGMPQHQEEGSQVSATTGTSVMIVKSYMGNCCNWFCGVPRFVWEKITNTCLLPVSHAFLSSSIWRTWLVVGNFILLFGNPIQMLVIPSVADPAMDVLYTLVFVTFIVDMVFRATAVKGYFSFSSGHIYKPSRNWLMYAWQWLDSIRFPSFLFACDLFSTLTLLADISFTNPGNFQLKQVEIDLADVVLPTLNQIAIVNRAVPWELNAALVVTVLKTARVVRFVRSQAVSTLISRVNWYWPMQRLNATYTAVNCCHVRDGRFMDDAAEETDGPNSKKEGSARRDRNDLSSSKNSVVAGAGGVETYQDSRRSSWGGLGVAALVAQRRAQEQDNDTTDKGFIGSLKKILRGLGLMSQDQSDWQRQMAAIKIQRFWRRVLAQRQTSDHFQDETFASGGGGTGSWKNKSIAKSNQGSKNNILPKSLRKMSIYPGMDATKISARISQKLKYAAGGDGAAESQVGGAMRELTGQRVAIGILVALLLTATFTYVEEDATRPATMVILHAQSTGANAVNTGTGFKIVATPPPKAWIDTALGIARNASVPDLYQFKSSSGDSNQTWNWTVKEESREDLREREKLKISITSVNSTDTGDTPLASVGWFAYREERKNEAMVQLFSTIFILLLWLFGVTAFAGPVMVLVVLPIERMVRLLGMLMVDPLGYQSTSKYRKFVAEEDELTKNTRWTKEVLKGMETSFLMSTILRIGSLMKVGFGSAGVEIIRKNLEKKEGGNVNLLTSKGLTVSCIFLFCDIRQFTDATECLQEEVFVFTNRIAAVVHSFCHSFGGSANKNVGDAFLCSWLLDTPPSDGFGGGDELYAKNNQADKCLLCVVKIIMALHHDNYYIETMSEAPRQRLLAKLKNRPGPVVQMGCGLHAGKAVQGAIGSERKIDATYVSEAVEMSEFLESSTKKYGLKMLMSNSFHNLLHSNNRQRCRLVDQIVIPTDDDDDEDELAIRYERDDIVELYTYDMDVDALWKAPPGPQKSAEKATMMDTGSVSEADSHSRQGLKDSRQGLKDSRQGLKDSRQGLSDRRGDLKKALSSQRGPTLGSTRLGQRGRRMSITHMLSKTAVNSSNTSSLQKTTLDGSAHDFGGTEHNSAAMKASGTAVSSADVHDAPPDFRKPELILPSGPALYNPAYWRSDVMFRIRKKYLEGLHGLFFHNYSQGLQSFYHRDWDRAQQSFKAVLDTFEDGPSRYFLNIIENNDGKIPPNFRPYGMA